MGIAKLSELVETFYKFDPRYSGVLLPSDILPALQCLGCKISEAELTAAFVSAGLGNRIDEVSLSDFKRLYQEICKKDPRRSTLEGFQPKTTLYHYGSAGEAICDDTLHSVSEEEQIAFSSWIEKNLREDADCKHFFPFEPEGGDLYSKCNDGVLLCKIINSSVPGTIDPRAVNVSRNMSTYQMHDNITLALNSARAIGCNVVNIGASDIQKGTKHLLLGLLWQIIKIGLLKQINVVAHAELATLLEGDETISDFAKLSPEDILIRWVNYHLKDTESDTRMKNFTADIRNCEVYAYLVEKIAPQEKKPFMHSTKAILDAVDLVQRAEMVLQNAEKLDCRVFVRPQDIVNGSQRLNLAFLANLFHGYPALEKPPNIEEHLADVEETREEKTYRNWINSMGIEPTVNHLFGDLTDGLVLLKLYDIVKQGSVDWANVHTEICHTPAKANFQRLENCNYVMELGRNFGFSLVGVAGNDIHEGKPMMTLALLWQLMRAYTFSVLVKLKEVKDCENLKELRPQTEHPIDESEIIAWANNKLQESGKPSRLVTKLGFSDPKLTTGLLLIDLIDAIRPGSVDYNVVMTGVIMQEKMKNAEYAITLARRIGAKVYASKEDIVELKPKMMMTIFACLMAVDLQTSETEVAPTYAQNISENHTYLDRTREEFIHTQCLNKLESTEMVNSDTHTDKKSQAQVTNKQSAMWYPVVTEIQRPGKLYVKTYNLTLTNNKHSVGPKVPNSKLFTIHGGAGDCVENKNIKVEKAEQINEYKVKKLLIKPRFSSPSKMKTDIKNDQFQDCGKSKAGRENEKMKAVSSVGSKPLIHVIHEGKVESVDAQVCTEEIPEHRQSSCNIKNLEDKNIVKKCSREVIEATRLEKGELFTTAASTWMKRKDDNCSHGGGRLFFAAHTYK